MLLHPKNKILIQIIIEWYHISAGVTCQILSNSTDQISYVSYVWFQDTIKCLFRYNIQVNTYQFFIITVQRVNDRCIIFDLIQLYLTKEELIQLKAYILYLQVSLLSDSTALNGKTIPMQFLRGTKATYLRSTFYWLNQSIPSILTWTRWFKRLNQIFKAENNGELLVSKQLKEWLVPIKERPMLYMWYYSEAEDEIFKLKKDSITRYFTNVGKYQTYSPNFGSKHTCNYLPEDAIPISTRERTTFKVNKQFRY